MFDTGRKFVRGIIDRPSSSKQKNSKDLLRLGKIEESDQLGASLHKEATTGHPRSLKKVLKSAICVDYPNDLGQTPLFCACARDNEDAALLLLKWRANPNEKSLDGMTPCHAACYTGNVYLLGKLIEAGGDLRLHDNDGNSMRDWALLNPDVRKRSKILDFIDKTQMYAMAYSGDSVSQDMKYEGKSKKQSSVMEIMLKRTGSDLSIVNLKQVHSTGFGKVYLGSSQSGGIVSVIPLIAEAVLFITDGKRYETGFHTYMERMQWLTEDVSVKQVRPDLDKEDGIDLLIADAEYLGKLRHPNILLLMGISQSAYLDKMMLVFEFVEHATLHHLLHTKANSLQYTDCLSIIHQVSAAISFIHNHNLIHCGLSSFAIYMVSRQVTKLGNFEFMVESTKADLGKPSSVSLVSHGEFLYHWMSPELVQGLCPHYSSDVYSFCCLMWEMFTCEVPWAKFSPSAIRKKLLQEKTQLNLAHPKIPARMKAILGYGLELKEENRLNKCSYINDWLKTDQHPTFRRTPSTEPDQNKSLNAHDWLQSLSTSSFESSSSSFMGEHWIGQAAGTQDLFDYSTNSQDHAIDDESQLDPRTSTFYTSFSAQNHQDYTKDSDTARNISQDSDSHSQVVLSHQPIKPASHVCSLNLGLPPSAVWELGQSLPPRRDAKFDSASKGHQIQAHLDDEQEYNCLTQGYVMKLADLYQMRMSQHKLRQSILRGSKEPGGSCPTLDSSFDPTQSVAADKNSEKCHSYDDVSQQLPGTDTKKSYSSHSRMETDCQQYREIFPKCSAANCNIHLEELHPLVQVRDADSCGQQAVHRKVTVQTSQDSPHLNRRADFSQHLETGDMFLDSLQNYHHEMAASALADAGTEKKKIDSDGVEIIIRTLLRKITDRMCQKSSQSDLSTSQTTSHVWLKDLTSSASEKGEDDTEKLMDAIRLDCAERNCEFEFQEFYIDDDLDLTDCIYHNLSPTNGKINTLVTVSKSTSTVVQVHSAVEASSGTALTSARSIASNETFQSASKANDSCSAISSGRVKETAEFFQTLSTSTMPDMPNILASSFIKSLNQRSIKLPQSQKPFKHSHEDLSSSSNPVSSTATSHYQHQLNTQDNNRYTFLGSAGDVKCDSGYKFTNRNSNIPPDVISELEQVLARRQELQDKLTTGQGKNNKEDQSGGTSQKCAVAKGLCETGDTNSGEAVMEIPARESIKMHSVKVPVQESIKILGVEAPVRERIKISGVTVRAQESIKMKVVEPKLLGSSCTQHSDAVTNTDDSGMFMSEEVIKYFKSVSHGNHGRSKSDSDSDQWVKNKLECLRSKMHRRKSRIVYADSSQDESDTEHSSQANCESYLDNQRQLRKIHKEGNAGTNDLQCVKTKGSHSARERPTRIIRSNRSNDSFIKDDSSKSEEVAVGRKRTVRRQEDSVDPSLHLAESKNNKWESPSNVCAHSRHRVPPPTKCGHPSRAEPDQPGCAPESKESIAPESRKSISRKKSNMASLADSIASSVNSFISSKPASRSKHSMDRDSKLSDKAIHLDHTSANRGENNLGILLGKPPCPASQKFRKSKKATNIETQEHEEGRVKTWLEQEHFSQQASLTSVKRLESSHDHVHTPSEQPGKASQSSQKIFKCPQKESQAVNSKYTSKSGRDKRQIFSLDGCGGSLSFVLDGESEVDGVERSSLTRPRPREADNSVVTDRGQATRMTSSSSADHCLTVDIQSAGCDTEHKPGTCPGQQPHVGCHRFYIPGDRCVQGCLTKMVVQLDPVQRGAHRVIATATDLRSGQTETLLDQSVVTGSLRSSLFLD